MTGRSPDAEHQNEEGEQSLEPIRYPMHHVVGVLGPEQLENVLHALTSGGFLESEIAVGCGAEMADRLSATTGRSGFAAQAIRFAAALGMVNEEGEAKARYERAMREGNYVIAVLAPTTERKARASEILKQHGGWDIGYFGRFTIQRMVPSPARSPTSGDDAR